jgi:hypothetical protein
LDARVKLHTKEMQMLVRRLNKMKVRHRKLMRSGSGFRKRGMIIKEMNIQEDLPPLRIKEASISMKETIEEWIVINHHMNPDGLLQKQDHLLLGIKICLLIIATLTKILDTRKLIVESMKGKTMKKT